MVYTSESQWRPTPSQRETFEEWKNYCINFLVSCQEGVYTRKLKYLLANYVGEPFPLEDMGFATANHFLYELRDFMDFRKLEDGRLFAFIKEHKVPEGVKHIRKLVLNQRKDKGCINDSGRIVKPTKFQTTYCRANELFKRPPRNGEISVPSSTSRSPQKRRNGSTSTSQPTFLPRYSLRSRSASSQKPRTKDSSPVPAASTSTNGESSPVFSPLADKSPPFHRNRPLIEYGDVDSKFYQSSGTVDNVNSGRTRTIDGNGKELKITIKNATPLTAGLMTNGISAATRASWDPRTFATLVSPVLQTTVPKFHHDKPVQVEKNAHGPKRWIVDANSSDDDCDYEDDEVMEINNL